MIVHYCSLCHNSDSWFQLLTRYVWYHVVSNLISDVVPTMFRPREIQILLKLKASFYHLWVNVTERNMNKTETLPRQITFQPESHKIYFPQQLWLFNNNSHDPRLRL